MNFETNEDDVKLEVKQDIAALPERMDQAIEADETQRMLDFYKKYDAEHPEETQWKMDFYLDSSLEKGEFRKTTL